MEEHATMRSIERVRAALAALAVPWVLGGCAAPGGAAPPAAPALDSLFAAERAFAAAAARDGIGPAFVAAFAPDGLMFTPQPRTPRAVFGANPPPRTNESARLAWAPAAGGLAASGDVGFTTGPYALSPASGSDPTHNGVFFSIWQRDAAGAWKVVVDAGIETPGPVDPAALAPAPRVGAAAPAAPADLPRASALEAPDATVPLTGSGPDSYAARFATDGRLMRDAHEPVIGRARIDAFLRGAGAVPAHAAFVPAGSGVARAGDLGWTWGRLTVTPAAAAAGTAALRSGWYVHLWVRDDAGDWRIAVATLLDDPPPR
jgi:ketosteroid isomerase-like protein